MSGRNAPLSRSRFAVEIAGVLVSGFRRVDIPRRYTRENAAGQPQWGQLEYDDLTMVRGMKRNDDTLYDWRKSVEQGKVEEGKKDVAVILQDETGTEQVRWVFTGAWPREYVPPTLDAGSTGDQGDGALEEITLVFDRMKRAE
jgi:phage tail-like protein